MSSAQCSACGSRAHRQNHRAASPCSRHLEALSTTPAAAGLDTRSGAGHGDQNRATTVTAEVRCEDCGELGLCPYYTDDEEDDDDDGAVWTGYDSCALCGEPDHFQRDCPLVSKARSRK